MTNLTVATPRIYELGDVTDLPVKAASAIFEGSAIGLASGYARHLADGDTFAGFALGDVASQTSDGDANVHVRTKGKIVLTISSVAVTDIGKAVYASDGNAYTLTAGNDGAIGRVARVYGTNLAVVAFDADRGGFGMITAFTDSSGGVASNTIVDQPGTYDETVQSAHAASFASKVNAIIKQFG